jgi:hypothetical protein
MQILNIHQRSIAAPVARVGALLDSIASEDDRFWPHEDWPAIKFDRPLAVGAIGGHGTGPYTVCAYTPGRHIRFEFGGRRSGFHEFEVEPAPGDATLLRHTLKARLPLVGIYHWYGLIRPLHDAVLEDLLDKVEGQVARVAKPQVWSARVVRLRRGRGLQPGRKAAPAHA